MLGIENTTVRMIITLPDSIATVQRLYDYGTWFKLEEEKITDVVELLKMFLKMKDAGAIETRNWKYVSDDDLKEHTTIVYELKS